MEELQGPQIQGASKVAQGSGAARKQEAETFEHGKNKKSKLHKALKTKKKNTVKGKDNQ